MDIGKRKTFTSSSLHYNNPPKIQFLSSISDLGFNMFWEWWREEGFRVQLMVNNREKGLISSEKGWCRRRRRRVPWRRRRVHRERWRRQWVMRLTMKSEERRRVRNDEEEWWRVSDDEVRVKWLTNNDEGSSSMRKNEVRVKRIFTSVFLLAARKPYNSV
jgi:hypothetical protein